MRHSSIPTMLRASCLLLIFSASCTLAQSAAPAPQAEPATAKIFNREVVTFRSTLMGASPEFRAERAEGRLKQQLDANDPKVTTLINPLGVIFEIDGNLTFVLTEADADQLNGETLQTATANTLNNLQTIITAGRESRNKQHLLRGLAGVAIATVLLLALFKLLNWLKRSADGKLIAFADARKIQVDGVEIISHNRIIQYVRSLTRIIYWLFALLLAYQWLSFCLKQFPYTQPWGMQLSTYFFDALSNIAQAVISAIPGLALAFVFIMMARFVIKGLTGLFDRIESGQAKLSFIDQELATPTRKIITVLIWLFTLVMAYPYLPGSDSDAFKGVSVFVGLMISLGASNIIGQGASGLILTYSKTFRKGEYVRIADQEGTVTELGMFTTRIRTGLGEEITISNSAVFGAVTKNYSRATQGSGYVLDTTVTIGYDTPWRQVEAMLLEAALRTDGIAAEPAPKVFQTSLSDFYPEYRLVCHALQTQPRPRAMALSALHANIQDVFNQYGVQIMSPHYVLDPNAEKIVSAERKFLAPAKQPE